MDYKTQNVMVDLLFEKFDRHKDFTLLKNEQKKIEDASHHSGTTRMSSNKVDGVVNKNCKVFDLKNLFISGSSVFRTIGSANPALTNIAMSIRLGKHIKKLIK